jgi:hypothetical protein
MKSTEDSRDPRSSGGQYSTSAEEFVPLEWVDTWVILSCLENTDCQDSETLEISEKLVSTDTSKEFQSSITGANFLGHLFFKDNRRDTNPIKME